MNLYCVQDWPGLAHEQHYCVKGIANALGVDPRTVERFFATEYRCTPRRWLMRERMRRARALLRGGALHVKEIATQLHYANAAAFGHAFRLMHKVSPRGYLRRLARQRRRRK